MKLIYAVMLTAIFSDIAVAQDAKIKAAADFGYASVAVALESMRAKSGVKESTQSGWTVIEDASTLSLWSFTLPGHSAHPAAVRRRIVKDGDNIMMQSNVLCEAPRPACDAVVAEFAKLDQAVRESLTARPPVNR
jgi:hypothetical protein